MHIPSLVLGLLAAAGSAVAEPQRYNDQGDHNAYWAGRWSSYQHSSVAASAAPASSAPLASSAPASTAPLSAAPSSVHPPPVYSQPSAAHAPSSNASSVAVAPVSASSASSLAMSVAPVSASSAGCVIYSTITVAPVTASVAPVSTSAVYQNVSVSALPATSAAAVGASSSAAAAVSSSYSYHRHSSAQGSAPAPAPSTSAVVAPVSIKASSSVVVASSAAPATSSVAPVKVPASSIAPVSSAAPASSSHAASKPPVYSSHAVSSAAPVPVSSAAPVPVSSAAPVSISSKAPAPSSVAPTTTLVHSTPAVTSSAPATTYSAPASGGAFPKIPNTLGTHDPSRVIQDGKCFYFYSTSGDLSGWYTCDGGSSWKNTPSILKGGIPSNVHQYVTTNDGHNIWAPDVIFNPNNNLFHIYYAVAAWSDTLHSAIGLVTSPTLDPATAKWTEMGTIIYRSSSSDVYSAIDPCPFFDDSGNMWLTLGSGYAVTRATAINIIPLDKNTGLRSGTSITTIQSCGCEASYIQPHGGAYYLFWNTGGCCSGAASTYTIHVAKSSSPTGPYGTPSVFLASFGGEHGPGQIGITTLGGVDYFTYHYYPSSGGSVLGHGTVDWSSGMPVAKPL